MRVAEGESHATSDTNKDHCNYHGDKISRDRRNEL
jgi:hypothetical protein